MRNSDRLRVAWLDREGQHPMLTTIYGPFPCYDKWSIRAYTVAMCLIAAVLVWVMR